MKFTLLGFTLAIACLFGTAVAEGNQPKDVARHRTMPKNTRVYFMGINGFLKKRKESRFFEAPKISATHSKQKRDVERPKKKEKRAVKYANSGTATFFTPNVGSCGWKNKASDLIVAVNGKDMKNVSGKSNKNPLCGKMVEVTDSSGKKIRAKIVDTVSFIHLMYDAIL